MPFTVLILGAAGRVGQVLSATFADAGWDVRAVARRALPAALAAHPRVTHVPADALDHSALRRAAAGVQVVVHAAHPVYTQWEHHALALVDAAIDTARTGNAALMLPGNVYNFGSALPEVLHEAVPERGDTAKARIRIETERRMAASGLDSVVIRAGDFFGGGGRGSWFDLGLASRLAAGRFVYPGAMHAAHAWAYLPDLAQAFVRVAGQQHTWRGFHRMHFAGHTVTGAEMQAALEAAAGQCLKPVGLPWWLMRAGAPLVPMWRELLAMRYLWQRPHRLEGTALSACVGALPHTPLHAAVAEALAALGPAALPAVAPTA